MAAMNEGKLTEGSWPFANWLVVGAAILFGIIDFVAFECPLLEKQIALQGWGPQHYVAQKLHPDQFQGDWHNGIEAYDCSIPMRVYFWLAKNCGLMPTQVMYAYVIAELILLSLAVAFLTQTLFGKHVVTIMVGGMALASPLFGANLGRFGQGLGGFPVELYYGYAHAFALFSIGCVLRRSYIPAALTLACAANCHIAIAAQAGFFLMPMLWYQRDALRSPAPWLAAALFLGLSANVVLTSLQAGAGIGPPVQEDWLQAMRIFSFHWFPLSMGLLTEQGSEELLAFVLPVFFLLQTLRDANKDEPGTQLLVGGTLVAAAFSVIGIVFSEFIPVPAIIRFCPQRITFFVTLLACIYIIRYLHRQMTEGTFFGATIGAFAYVSFFLARPGIGALPLSVLLLMDVFSPWRLKLRTQGGRTWSIMRGLLAASVLLLLMFHGIRYVLAPRLPTYTAWFVEAWDGIPALKMLNPDLGSNFFLHGGALRSGATLTVAAVIAVSLLTLMRLSNYSHRGIRGMHAALVVAVTAALLTWCRDDDRRMWIECKGARATAFLELQHWCRDHTAANSVFLLDPSEIYGWRDFSERSSFGVSREWAYSTFVYMSGRHSWTETVERMRLFDVDLLEVLRNSRTKNRCSYEVKNEINHQLSESFRNLDLERLRQLHDRYGVRYVVAQRELTPHKQEGLLPVFENNEYVLFEIRQHPFGETPADSQPVMPNVARTKGDILK